MVLFAFSTNPGRLKTRYILRKQFRSLESGEDMSYKSLLTMRCDIVELRGTNQDGLRDRAWLPVEGGENIRCFLDLGFIRSGKDPIWVPDSKTAQNRSGVLFLPPKTVAVPGNRIKMLKGPGGTFQIESSMDEAWTPRKLHHLECFVEEVDRVLANA